ncbi:MAG: UDP-N-acetylmuramoyl-L-alanyl-D-glutamate--2,6-diaminopimelate ligase [Myxococcota bacterium]|nr:UDP-N-acetylmuramoyl-L-alanyl-D-glutamate--2,6-diaminopimelate ligase [Myxococcota bacterium]
MRLSTLLAALPPTLAASRPETSEDPVIRGIECDSRKVSPGDVFVALRGENFDGHDHLAEAEAAGAIAHVVESVPAGFAPGAPAVVVRDTRRALAPLSVRFYGDPSKELRVVGITGTNGKTSTSFLVDSILRAAGIASGVIGTLGSRIDPEEPFERSLNTTPESLDLQRLLRSMCSKNVSAVAMEVSSHGLELGRVDGCGFEVAAITNLTQDHLDFHRSLDAYRDAKRRLFVSHLRADGAAVVNVDDPHAEAFLEAASARGIRLVRVSTRSEVAAEVRTLEARVSTDGTRARVATPEAELTFELPLLGDFNVENAVVAVGIAHAMGIAPDAITEGLERCPQVPGRVERVDGPGAGPRVLVDYAHTPDAVEKLLATMAPLTKGRLITVFGCGGDRDPTKRAPMAEAVARFSDRAIATSDNPRTEDPLHILADVEAGLGSMVRAAEGELDTTERGYRIVVDRRDAIADAIAMARRDDTVVLAGKGHEDYQIIGTEKLPFDDRDVARRLLAEGGAP